MADIAPVLLFTYKRLDTLKETVAALQNNFLAKETDLFIFSDNEKNEGDKPIVNTIREYLKTISGFKSVKIYEAKFNKGLANSILDGVSEIIQLRGKAIVLEDDLLTTRNFLNFMNDALVFYETQKSVFSISGYSFNLNKYKDTNKEAYFLNRGWSWGWATWEDRWSGIDWEVKDYETFSKNKMLTKEFAKGGSDLNSMLKKQMNGALDSWAIRWLYHQYKVKGLTLFPVLSKVYNNGFDTDATHTSGSPDRYLPNLDNENSQSFTFPLTIRIDDSYQKLFQEKMGIKQRIISRYKSLIKSLTNKIK